MPIIETQEDKIVAAAVTAVLERLPAEAVEEILGGMSTDDRMNVLDVVLAYRALR